MEMARQKLFREVTKQKREMTEQLQLDMRQRALLLHDGAAWHLWNTQEKEWLEKAQKWKRLQSLVRLAREEREGREEVMQDRGYWAIGVMTIQSEGVRKAIKQEEKMCKITLKLDCKEAKYRTMLMSMETRQRWAVEQRSIEAQYKRGTEEIKHQRTADWAAIWREDLFMRIPHQQQVRRENIWKEEASHFKKLEAGRRRLTNRLTIEQEGTLTADELEDISTKS